MAAASSTQGWAPLSSVFHAPTLRGQTTPSLPSTGQQKAVDPSPPPAPGPDIHVGENGRIHGVDGMLDQIAQALTRHAGPMLVRDVLPAVQQDAAMQQRIGQAAGQAVADRWRPWLIAGVGAIGVLTLIEILRFHRERRKP